MVPLCKDISVGLTPYSRWRPGVCHGHGMKARQTDALAQNKYGANKEADKRIVDRLSELVEKRGLTRTQIALARLLHKEPVVSPIIGSYRMSHLEDAVDAVSVRLSPEEITFLEELYIPHPIQGHH